MHAEGWDPAEIVRGVAAAVGFARAEGLRVCIVTEDTTRSRLDVALDIYLGALNAGAERVCVCDTVGYAVPWGAAALVRQLRSALSERGFGEVGVDWHGHNDRGLALANSLAAATAGADRLHGSALGIGERAGNASVEQLLVNLNDLGWRDGDLRDLPRYCAAVSRSCGIDIPMNQPFVGDDVYRTATGVHAAAIRKARAMGDTWTAGRVYAGIPAGLLGLDQRVEVGPGSGQANIMLWLERHRIEPDEELVARLEEAVAVTTRVLTDDELMGIVAGENVDRDR
jgi:2-isopropylmalate synthase